MYGDTYFVLQHTHTLLLLTRVISISACLKTHPSSIAMRYVQRQILMGDPDWMEGNYYDITFPRMGMIHARYNTQLVKG